MWFIESLTEPSDALKDVIIPLASAIIGAVAGAAASYWPARSLAKRSSDEVLLRDAAARRDEELRAARQVFVKLTDLANTLGTYRGQVEEMISIAERNGDGTILLHQKLSAFPAIDREPSIIFSAEELSIYIAAKRPDFVDDLLLLSRRHAAIVSGLSTFAEMKTAYHYETAQHGKTTRDEQGRTTTKMHLPPHLANYFQVKSDELEFFATHLRKQLNEYADFSAEVATRFSEITDAYLGDGALPKLVPA